MPKLQASLDHLNRNLTFYGEAQNRVQGAVKDANNRYIALSRDLSNLQDADPVAAIVELNLSQVHQETALASHSKLPRTSLFDFLG
jgi:flagellin-like hook-associated protein FlgL